ncbi:neutral alpha-glucosidase AB-like [Diorhabda sublineata]|uniref:neutral alpha-glucosidase AB-like n=1 Tax=Diorhabda sublineata TaxID=1163346 RepID=UPI0024E09B54|nr:neutral alpha-glucosidase AB-like [Diorhabda sublineata]
MLRLLMLLLFLNYGSTDIYKSCKDINFCNELRNIEPVQFSPQFDEISEDNNVVTIPLVNKDKQELNLKLTILENYTVRVKVTEKNKTRYELKDVLFKEPDVLEVVVDKSNADLVTLSPKDGSLKVVITSGTSFKVEFYYEDILEIVFVGENLVFSQVDNAFGFVAEFSDIIQLYGLHHHAVKLELPVTKDSSGKVLSDPYRNRNSDNANYPANGLGPLYGTVPVVYGHSEKHTSGIFLHNAAEQWVDLWYNSTSGYVYFMAESGTLDLFILLGDTPKAVVRQFTGLTGVAHMPQLWTLGYHQCRWSYFTQEDAWNVVTSMSRNHFPLDAIWLDIDYTDEKKYFTWNPVNYSDPIQFQANISGTNKKLVAIIDPHIKVDENYPVYEGAKDKYFVRWSNGTDYVGNCWPGESSYIDFLNPEARNYYSNWYSYDKFVNSTSTLAGIWNDMNEPSVFDDSTEKSLPYDVLHYGEVQHRDVHNIYGLLHTMSTHKGLMDRDNGTIRPFILTRSTFAGSQRYAAMWTGDNTADWPYLQISYSECLLSNIVGLVFCGADVGGFFDEPTAELLQRWYQAAIWLPFFRGHASNTVGRREPYLFEKDVQNVIRNAMEVRYSHIPMWYTLFYEHTITGDPVVRPIFYEYPGITNQDYHILLGSSILARPVMDKGAKSVNVSFPGTKDIYWYRIDDDSYKIFSGDSSTIITVDINTSPYFYKGGSIIARKNEKRYSTTDMQSDPFDLYITLDSNGEAEGTLYVDDYTSFKYRDEKLYFYVRISYITETGGISIEKINGGEGDFVVNIKQIIVVKPSNLGTNKYVYEHLADGAALKSVDLCQRLKKNQKVNLVF